MKAVVLALASLLLASCLADHGFAAETGDLERKAHMVDQAAVDAKLKAIHQLQILLTQRRGTSAEPNLILSLAELEHECAKFEFRIAHGNTMGTKGKSADLKDYKTLLVDATEILSRFMQKYPTHAKVPRAHYLRGKSLLELGRVEEAANDLKFVIEQFPNDPDFKFSAVALIDLLMQQKDYAGALHYVKVLHATPSDRVNYPIALDRAAWAHYYLNDIPMALRNLETEARYLKALGGSTESKLDKERTINGIALFYATGMEQKLIGFTSQNAYNYFYSVADGDGAPSMLVQVAYLLRTKGWDDDLDNLKKASVAQSIPEETRLDLALVVFENQVNRHRFVPLQQSIAEMDQWFSRNPSLVGRRDRALKTISETAVMLQTAFTENRDSQAVAPIATTLGMLYTLMLKLPNPDPKGSPDRDMKLHFNIAEISFTMKDYDKAVAHYRWVVEHPVRTPTAQKLVADCALKAISSKYEQINGKGLFPKDLQAKSLRTASTQKLPADILTWIKWVDEYMTKTQAPARKSGEVFLFEANRLLYSQGLVAQATERMVAEIPNYEESKYAVPSAALVMDTYVSSEDWAKTYEMAQKVATLRAWSPEFQASLRGIQGDAFFKLVENEYKQKNYAAVLEKSVRFLAENPDSHNRDNCILLAANSALALKDKATALTYFAKLHVVTPELKSQITLTQVAVAEEKYDFAGAVKGIASYLALPNHDAHAADVAALRKKAALYAFIEAPAPVSSRLRNAGICADDARSYCEHLDAVAQLISKELPTRKNAALAASKAVGGGPEAALWGVIALRNARALASRDRERVLQSLASYWQNSGKSDASSDAFVRFLLVPYMPPVVEQSIRLVREEIAASARIKQITRKALSRRVQLLGEFEKLAALPLKMPWSSVRSNALSELSDAYFEFASELRKIPVPKGLAGQDLADYQNTMAQMIEPLQKKSDDYRKQSADLAMAVSPDFDQAAFTGLLSQFEDAQAHSSSQGNQAIVPLWATAVREQNWPKVAFFMTQLKRPGAMSTQDYGVAEGISIYAAGGKAEGLAEIRDIQNKGAQRMTASVIPAAPPGGHP